MTHEKLDEARKLQEKIAVLRSHAEGLKSPEFKNCGKIYIEAEVDRRNCKRILRSDYLPIDLPTFIDLYLIKVEKEIKELEDQFDKL